ncbi:MAG: reprolysin-like metallopeptidase, partial [Limisphaerales bacterium]
MTAPQSYETAQLNQDALIALLSQAPLEFTDEAASKQVVLTLPMPSGALTRFRVEESPIMEPALAAQHPEIKTYSGQGIDDPTATTRLDWTPLGLHAIVLSADGTAFIEPVSSFDTTTYISYFNHDVSTDKLSLSCLLSDAEIADAEQRGIRLNQGPGPSAFVTGPTLRTYRLAVAATGEFTQQYGGGDVNTTLTQITTLINQVNALYRKEATITFQLIANETSIIFTDPVTDGYTNGSPSTMLAENQTKLNAVIGSANYDIGHVFGGITVSPGFVSFSGVAAIGVVCDSANKARGVSTMGGASSSFPHSIFVSGVTHEMAHQFSAPHTFNSTTSGCSGQRSAAGAYEPGSGSTIMGYSICGSDNLQTLPDLYFHTGSLEQVVSYAAGAGNCASTTTTGNSAPIIATLSNFTIPANTPFTLTASVTDPNGDPITGGWEEFDLGAASPPNTDDGTRPILRSFIPTSSTARTFPKLQYILNNANVPPTNYSCGSSTCLTGELLPSTTRTMNFRFTARDNRAAGGGTANAPMQVNAVSTAGPFAVTQPNTAVSWSGGSSQVVTWNVNSTNLAPISCANVKISLSTDGGNTFPVTLAATTPNDGTETIVVPNMATTTARIKVEAVGNVFFDVSNTNFTIVSSQTSTLTVASSNPASGVSITVSPNDNNGQGSGVTQFTRVYNNNTSVNLTAPSTAGGNNFQKWQRDGVDFTTSLTANLAMDASHTMTAVYVSTTRTLTVASSNPSSGVSITVSPNDNNGQGSG